eukprot:jgi/Ulvmu1/8417/UM042_0124.1
MKDAIFQHESICGACERLLQPSPRNACSAEADTSALLRCSRCPAAYHYGCAGYYDSADGPSSKEAWACWRCAGSLPGGLQRNWISPKLAARPDDEAYIAPHAHSVQFRRATVVAHHATYIMVDWRDDEAKTSSSKREPEVIPRESTNVWHGTITDEAWEPLGSDSPGLYVPKSRRYCPETFAEIAAKHGLEPPEVDHMPAIPQVRLGGRPRQSMVAPAAAPAKKDPPAASPSSEPHQAACTPPSTAAKVPDATPADHTPSSPTAAAASAATPTENGFTNHDRDAKKWLGAVRRYGNLVSDPVLQQMPRYLGLRRDLFVQTYALWLVVMAWGGEEALSENKLWSAVAAVFQAPTTMTNRSLKMRQLWAGFHLSRLDNPEAAKAGVTVPPFDSASFFSRRNNLVAVWPACMCTELSADDDIGRASNRGAFQASAPGASRGQPFGGVWDLDDADAGGRGRACNGRGRGRGGSGGGARRGRGRSSGPVSGRAPTSRNRSAASHEGESESESSESEDAEEEEEEEEGEGEEEEEEATKADTQEAPAAAPQQASRGKGGKGRKSGGKKARRQSGGDSASTQLSDDEDVVEDAAAALVVEDATRLRQLPLSALPPKLPPGGGLPEGAIWTEHVRQLRLGEYMLRLDVPSIHTALLPLPPAVELARGARAGKRARVQFVSTEKDFLGGWWDARLADARTGSTLEGGLRFLVEEHYPGDPLDPHPTTWVPLTFYGPQPYPFQTPQVMVRPRPDWAPSPRVAVGEVVEAIDDADEDDTVLWRGVVHKEKGKDSVVVRLFVAPYGNAGVAVNDPEAEAANFATHPRKRVRRAPADDLLGLAREPPDAAPPGVVRCLATTDQMEYQVLKPSKFVIGGPGSGAGGHIVIESHPTFKTAEAAATAAAEDGRGPAQRKGGFEARAPVKKPKARAAMNAAILKAFQARAQASSVAGGHVAPQASDPRLLAAPTNGRRDAAQLPQRTADAAAAKTASVPAPGAGSAASAGLAPRADSAPAAAAGGAVLSLSAALAAAQGGADGASLKVGAVAVPEGAAQNAAEDKAAAAEPPMAVSPGSTTAAGAVEAAPAPRPLQAVAAAAVMSAQVGTSERRNGSRGATPPPESQIGSMGHLGLGEAPQPGMWGALGGVLGHAASAAPVSSTSGLSQLLSTAGMMGAGGPAALGLSGAAALGQHAQPVGVSASHTQLIGTLGGGFGMGFGGALPAHSAAAATAAQVPPAAANIGLTAAGITAAEQEVIDALRARAQLEQACLGASAHPVVPPHLLISAPQQGMLWPSGAAWGSTAAASSAPARVEAAPAADPAPPPPPQSSAPVAAEDVNPAASISPQHMELLVALLNGQDVRSHPGYQSLRQVLLGERRPTYDDLLRQRWSRQ